jgi:hypothetical protein
MFNKYIKQCFAFSEWKISQFIFLQKKSKSYEMCNGSKSRVCFNIVVESRNYGRIAQVLGKDATRKKNLYFEGVWNDAMWHSEILDCIFEPSSLPPLTTLRTIFAQINCWNKIPNFIFYGQLSELENTSVCQFLLFKRICGPGSNSFFKLKEPPLDSLPSWIFVSWKFVFGKLQHFYK